MRPEILYSLFSPVTSLKGVGEKLLPIFARLLKCPPAERAMQSRQPLVRDLVFHVPDYIISWVFYERLEDAPLEQPLLLRVRVVRHLPPSKRGAPYRIIVTDGEQELGLVYFHGSPHALAAQYVVGSTRVIGGKLERYGQYLNMPHPEYNLPADHDTSTRYEPYYALAEGITQARLRTFMALALAQTPDLPEWLDANLLAEYGWPSWRQALHQLHQPESLPEDMLMHPARMRLAYDELLASQLAMLLARRSMRCRAGVGIAAESPLQQQLRAVLPFTLTPGQEEAVALIAEDMRQPERMLRMLQADVGSGKTIVALLSMLPILEAGGQCALLAPTEILARQHMHSFSALLAPLGIHVALLLGSMPAKARASAEEATADGRAQIIIGTHALFQEKTSFYRLGYIVVDEQHRFGVGQRLQLAQKGENPHMLLMSATPIPRSLSLMLYGDMDSIRIMHRPEGRTPITTSVMPNTRLPELLDSLQHAIASGKKAYWICPLVEEGEGAMKEVQAVEQRYAELMARFGERVAMVHGRISGELRDDTMQRFKAGEHQVLVATTVVEVGVDVPDASIIIIENAERFGMAQLHQLRGRVGRGAIASSCVLLYGNDCSKTALERLKIMRATQDGFVIAEEDLRLRGGGEVLGTRQSGIPALLFADFYQHRDLMRTARRDAAILLERDASLTSPRGQSLRMLLALFGHQESMRLLEAG